MEASNKRQTSLKIKRLVYIPKKVETILESVQSHAKQYKRDNQYHLLLEEFRLRYQ